MGQQKSFTIILTAEQISAADQQRTTRTQISAATINQQQTNGTVAGAEVDGANRTATVAAAKLAPQQIFLDRHVATENEVLPNLESNPNKFWTKRFIRGLKSSLLYRFRVYCSLNHFGDGCNTFCRPHDDKFGHYNCSSSGQKTCLDGWHGANCEKPKCRAGCSHGFCDVPNTCQCRPGWGGQRCDECLEYPGCKNGYCLSAWQCTCRQGWGGVLCDQDMDYCGSHEPCKNNATCQNLAPGRYKCNCPDGFTGVNCETSLSALFGIAGSMTQLSAGCALNPCLNGGVCLSQSGQSNGAAADRMIEPTTTTTTTTTISTWPMDSVPAQENRQYKCVCPAGWNGNFCQWQDELPLNSSLPGELLPAGSFPDEANDGYNWTAQDQLPEKVWPDSPETNGSAPVSMTDLLNTEFLVPPSPASQLDAQTSGGSQTATHTTLDMKHLISGVVIASVIGVFLAFLSLTWCCLIAIERNGFSFIQMNIIKSNSRSCESEDSSDGNAGEPIVSSTLRRMHNKIRDSFRRRRSIKPETKLNIENVLRPQLKPPAPPTYEESKYNINNKTRLASNLESVYSSRAYDIGECRRSTLSISQLSVAALGEFERRDKFREEEEENSSLVRSSTIRGALEEKIALKSGAKGFSQQLIENQKQHNQYACPKHNLSSKVDKVSGCDNYNLQTSDEEVAATTIEIEYQPETSTTRTLGRRQQQYRHQLAPNLHILASGLQFDLTRHKQRRDEEPPPPS